MAHQATTTQPAAPARCEHRSAHGLGCARSAGHSGSHWLTAQAEAARADLLRIGFFRQG
jgi:hypothetical protein